MLLALSFALTPIVLFNQQVITGHSLQPLHYELYIAKYLTLLSLTITIWLLRPRSDGGAKKRATASIILAAISLVALGWGVVETVVQTNRHAWASIDRDISLPVPRRLAEISRASVPRPDTHGIVLYFNLDHADISPSVAPQPVLWAPHTPAFSGVTTEENRERLYQYLYYTNEELANIDVENFETLPYRKRFLVHSLIEWGHNDAAWTVNWRQITPEDIRAALQAYARYADAFSLKEATHPTLSYVVTITNAPPDFKNLDKWYERDAGERVGLFTIYKVIVKSEK